MAQTVQTVNSSTGDLLYEKQITQPAYRAVNRKIEFSPPDISRLEIQEVVEALRSGWITTGLRVKELERRLAEYCMLPVHDGIPNMVCLASCTAAEELNLRMLGIGAGDEVIVPAYTYTATASAAVHVGARVVFIDSQPGSLQMDYDQMEAAINVHTKAVIPVDLGGIPCDYDRIFEILEHKRKLFIPSGNTKLGKRIQTALGRIAVVADCAHALGSSLCGQMAGSIADFSSFSFHAVKNFTTAEGGASAWRDIPGIDSAQIYNTYQLYSLHGQSKDALAKTQAGAWEYDIVAPWYKCNMTDVAAAIGLGQLDRYHALLEKRRVIAGIYDSGCAEAGVKYLRHLTQKWNSSCHLYITHIPWADDAIRREVILRMAEKGIVCNVHYKPLPMMTGYKKYGWKMEDFPNACKLYQNEVTLPLHTKLSNADAEYVIETYKETVRKTQ